MAFGINVVQMQLLVARVVSKGVGVGGKGVVESLVVIACLVFSFKTREGP
jgi:hypothetical protein